MIISADIKTLFASQLARIQDPETVDKVLDTWVLACELGTVTNTRTEILFNCVAF